MVGKRHWCRELRANDRYAKSDFNQIREHIGTDDQRHWLRKLARSTIRCGYQQAPDTRFCEAALAALSVSPNLGPCLWPWCAAVDG